MLEKIRKLVEKTPGIKGRKIASVLGIENAKVNRALHDNRQLFRQDSEYQWWIVSAELKIQFPICSWLDVDTFEKTIAAGESPLDGGHTSVVFVLANTAGIILDAMARLLALSNQLVASNKNVIIDMSDCNKTLTYLDRVGFFDHLHSSITVLPNRPISSRARTFKGNNLGVVELEKLDLDALDESIPERLSQSLSNCAGDKYSVVATTIIGELFNNVKEHSRSAIPGFAALQFYKGGGHIQTVISDSGKGIIGTLRPVLETRYPKLAKKLIDAKIDPDALLLKEVLTKGGFSQVNSQGRGLGLMASNELASRFNAIITIRQENLQVQFSYRAGVNSKFTYKPNMTRILGTHICFDFLLD
ncbi:MAG: hypothetical protein K2P61_01870 [Burkholderiaceae bacterium]|nr:hypothetical protein [Burkholderiaceae bacterium]